MPAVIVVLIIFLAIGLGGAKEETRVNPSVNFKFEVDSKGNASSRLGVGVRLEDPDGQVKIIIGSD